MQNQSNSIIKSTQKFQKQQIHSQSSGQASIYNQYISLLKQNGLQINSKCFVSYFKLKNGLQYPGIATRQHISKNQIMTRILRNLILSSFDCIQQQQLQQIYKQDFYHQQGAWKQRVLVTYLLYIYSKQQQTNVWYHMVKHYSKDMDILGVWPMDDINKLHDQSIKRYALRDKQCIQQQWNEFSKKVHSKHQILMNNKVFSKQNYIWIFVHLKSRTFGKPLQFTSCLPFGDLFNHHNVDGHFDIQDQEEFEQQDQDQGQNIKGQQDQQNLTDQQDNNYVSSSSQSETQSEYDKEQQQTDQNNNNLTQKNQSLSEQTKQISTLLHSQQSTLQFSTLKSLSQQLIFIIPVVQIKSLLNLNQNLSQKKINSNFTIIFVLKLIEICSFLFQQHKNKKITDKQVEQCVKNIKQSIRLYRQKLIQFYKQLQGRRFEYNYFLQKEEVQDNEFNQVQKLINNEKDQQQNDQHQQDQQSEQQQSHTLTLIQFPSQQLQSFDNVIFKTGRNDSYQPYSQVYFSYGPCSNKRLLLNYGFCIQENKYQYVKVKVNLGDFDMWNIIQQQDQNNKNILSQQLLKRLKDDHNCSSLLKRKSLKFKLKANKLNIQMIMLFRLINWQPQFNSTFTISSSSLADYTLNNSNQLQQLFNPKNYNKQSLILIQLRKYLLKQLQKYQNQSDNLYDPKLSYHQYYIAVYHLEKQKILQNNIKLIQRLIMFLSRLLLVSQQGQQKQSIQQTKNIFSSKEKHIFKHYLSMF